MEEVHYYLVIIIPIITKFALSIITIFNVITIIAVKLLEKVPNLIIKIIFSGKVEATTAGGKARLSDEILGVCCRKTHLNNIHVQIYVAKHNVFVTKFDQIISTQIYMSQNSLE